MCVCFIVYMGLWTKEGEHCSQMSDVKCKPNFIGKPEWKRLFGKSRCSLDDNIKMDLKEVACKNVNWSCLLGFI